jgi:hypothetical protein
VKISYLEFRLKAKKKIMHKDDFKPKNDLKLGVDNDRFWSVSVQTSSIRMKPWVKKPSPFPSDCVYGYVGCRFELADLHGFESFKTCKFKKKIYGRENP